MCGIQKGVGAKLQPWMDYTENHKGSVGGFDHTELPLIFIPASCDVFEKTNLLARSKNFFIALLPFMSNKDGTVQI